SAAPVDLVQYIFFFSGRRRHTISKRDWSSDVCSSDLIIFKRVISLLPLFIVSHIIIPLLYFSFVHNLNNYPSCKILFLQVLTELLQNKLLFHLTKRHFIICF